MAAAYEHIMWLRRANEDDADKLATYYHAIQHEWHTTPTFKNNLKLLATFCPRLRQHLAHSGATNWALPRDDAQLQAILACCKDQAEIEADRVRAKPPPATPQQEGAEAGGSTKGRNKRLKDAADASVPLPTKCYDAIAAGWGTHNAPKGKQLCVNYTYGTCKNTPSGEGCTGANGQVRLHKCCFCGTNDHPVGEGHTCPSPKRPSS